ncbi:Uma2 family endonuclease [candidate division KSB1 bacterium]|nr:Uma2 family endonuclease [candidate division KSB1 bacterium]NIR69557.1 Uma2 family endonuclease [candidate division KSB1 bacterium]NIS25905.1 Uma2 family endonuclease [candidate division KSB1 bacterium]NIT72786.1 Uma2 family endonuclease [candidate division KSB1 bacterium]NIU26593.1 Uma2 family endonuclease [candidate division KSB1 bacterium]
MSTVTEKTITELESKLMTEEDFVEACDEEVRAEFKDGEVIVHSPSPIKHGNIARFVGWIIQSFVSQQDLGHVMDDNIQVRLRPGLRRIPDLLFISKENDSEIRETEVEGGPDLIVEIVSSDSVERDWRDKYLEYENARVREYWIIDPNNERFCSLLLKRNR